MDIVYKNRWGVYHNGKRIVTYWNKAEAENHARRLRKKNPIDLYAVKQVSWFEE